ncbi:MAG TPA: DNA polymerase III subunit gamma/tau, partial [Coprothermobacter sp.]|nr:DNA polymerase III subunit gamma/tau [Coprothermobacter sp.]
EYFPLYVVLKEGKARVEGDRLVLSFPGLLHIYRRFMELPQVQKVLHEYGSFKVDLELEEEEKDESVLEVFKKVFPEAQIEEVKSN